MGWLHSATNRQQIDEEILFTEMVLNETDEVRRALSQV